MARMPTWSVLPGDVLDVAKSEAFAARGPFDALLSDPPYGISFMGHEWDHGVPSSEVWRALAAHLRPGSNVAAFGGTRTWHRLAVAMEDSGLEMRDSIMAWMYGSGWAKPANVSLNIDKSLGAEREVIGDNPNGRPSRAGVDGHACGAMTAGDVITVPATPEAIRFEGWHANLSPSWEPALLFRRPLDGTLAKNALEHGVAGLWVDGARTPAQGRERKEHGVSRAGGDGASGYDAGSGKHAGTTDLGRWPKNAILCCEETTCGDAGTDDEHAPGCPVHALVVQSGERKLGGKIRRNSAASRNEAATYGTWNQDSVSIGYADTGTAARFFYIAKVSRRERAGIPHPCMKPIALCRQIATLLLPPPRADGQPRRILVPYSGSGSEMIGALQAGWDEVIGIEMDPAWVSASRARIADFTGFPAPKDEKPSDDAPPRPGQLGLFS